MTHGSPSAFYTEIIGRLDGVRRRRHNVALVYGLLATVLAAFAVLLLCSALEGVFRFGTAGRTILFGAAALLLAGTAGWFVLRPLLLLLRILRSDSDHTLALKVGAYFPHVRDRLLDALQIYEERENLRERYSLSLIDASFADLYRDIQPLRFTDAVSDAGLRSMRKTVSYAMVIFLLLFVIPQLGLFDSAYRILRFNVSFASPLPLELIVEPGNRDAVRGETVPITVRAKGAPVRRLTLGLRQEGQVAFETVPLAPGGSGEFHTDIENIKATTEYYAEAGDIRSGRYTITVLDRPLVRRFRIRIAPPAYTRLPERDQEENIGDVSLYPGSTMKIELQASKPLSSAAMIFREGDPLPFAVTGAAGKIAVTPRKEGSYHFLLHDRDSLANIDPVEYSVKLLQDERPTAELLVPGKDVDVTEEMKLDLLTRIRDDFGFSKLRLAYRLAQSRYEPPQETFTFVDIPLPPKDQTSADVWYHWDLTGMQLVPEDALAYYVEVFDNDNVNGPKSGRTGTYIVRLPSLEEVLGDVDRSQQQSLESMENASQEAQQLKKEVEELHRELQSSQNKVDWQQQKKAEQLLQRYEEMKKNLEQTARKMDETVKKMDENNLLSPKTMEKYQELQKLLDQLNSPELQNALKKLQESMKQLSPEEMRRAMEQLKSSEDQFRKSLERTIELLKRIAIEQKLDELIKRTQEMQKQQEDLRRQASEAAPSDEAKRDELAAKQEELQKQMSSLEKQTSELKNKMEEFPREMPVEQMSKAEQSMLQKQTGKKMNSAAQEMRGGQMQSAQQNQESSEQDLEQMEKELSEVQKQLQENQMKQVVNEMRKQLQNVLKLSQNEESLKNASRELDPNSPSFRKGAENQNDVMSELGKVADALSELSKKTFAVSPQMSKELGNALSRMQGAMQNMETRNPFGTSQQQAEAMGSLNRAAAMMQSMIQAMGRGGSGGTGMAGLMGRLGQMAGQQSGINSGTQQAMGMGGGQGQGLSTEQQAAYQRLASQQTDVQKSLKQLSEEAKNTGDFSKLLGDLDKIAHDMQEIVGDLNQGDVNPETLQKQERILSRLLDASRSARERDYEPRRKAEAGKEYPHASPAEIDLTTQEGRNKLREELLKIRGGKYTKDYEDLIRRYYEELEKEAAEQQ